MKVKFFSLFVMLALVVALFGQASPVQATAGYDTSFITSITYQNVGTGDAIISVIFYPSEGTDLTPITFELRNAANPLKAGAGSSLFVGSVSTLPGGFKGAAVMSSNQPLVTTLVQIPQSPSTVKNRPLSSGFSQGDDYVLVPTVLKNFFGSTSVFAVQNVDTEEATVTVKFVPVANGGTAWETAADLAVGAAKYYDLGKIDNIGGTFNGSVQVNAVKKGTTTPGSVVATSLELGTGSSEAVYAFEGTGEASTSIYMPSALCNAFGGQNSFYAIQNTTAETANVTVAFTYPGATKTVNVQILGGQKASVAGCGSPADPALNNKSGSAKITSDQAIVAIGKVSGSGLSTAFLGFPSGTGKIALPYIRWTESQWVAGGRQRANVAIQNVGSTDLAAGDVVIKYYGKDGELCGSDELIAMPAGGKANSNPAAIETEAIAGCKAEFGVYADGSFGGGAVVETKTGVTAELAVIVRVGSRTATGQLGEDYNGIPIP